MSREKHFYRELREFIIFRVEGMPGVSEKPLLRGQEWIHTRSCNCRLSEPGKPREPEEGGRDNLRDQRQAQQCCENQVAWYFSLPVLLVIIPCMGNIFVDFTFCLLNKRGLANLKTTVWTGVDSLQNATTTGLDNPQYHTCNH